MSATVAAALKKIAVALLTNKKTLKVIGGIVLGIIIIIIMPVVAIISIFNGGIEIDTNQLQQMVVQNLSAEEQAKLQFVENTMYAIEDGMTAAGFGRSTGYGSAGAVCACAFGLCRAAGLCVNARRLLRRRSIGRAAHRRCQLCLRDKPVRRGFYECHEQYPRRVY